MKDVVFARGIGLAAALVLVGLVVSGLAMMQIAPIAGLDGPRPPPVELIRPKVEPPPPLPPVEPIRPRPTQTVRPTEPAPFAPPTEVDIQPSPQPAPFIPAPIVAIPQPAPAVIETARPLSAPPRPIYPERALARDRQGVVVVRLIVGADGDVTSAAIVSEDPPGFGFGQAALAAVRRTKFEPKRIDGAPTLGEFTYTVRFRLND